jgi:hypothetical protein
LDPSVFVSGGFIMGLSGKRRWRRADEWRELVAQQEKLGQTVRGFCRERGLSTTAFYRWRGIFRREETVPARRDGMLTGSAFAEVSIAAETCFDQPSAELRCGGVSLVFRGAIDKGILREAVSAFKELSC